MKPIMESFPRYEIERYGNQPQVPKEGSTKAVPSMDFRLGKTAAVDIEILPDCVSKSQKEPCKKCKNGLYAASDIKEKPQPHKKLEDRKSYCGWKKQFLGQKAISGNKVCKGPWSKQFRAPGQYEYTAQQYAHHTVWPRRTEKQGLEKCQCTPQKV